MSATGWPLGALSSVLTSPYPIPAVQCYIEPPRFEYSERQIARIIKHLLTTTAYIHEMGVIHRGKWHASNVQAWCTQGRPKPTSNPVRSKPDIRLFTVDLKFDNILLSSKHADARMVVSDFGHSVFHKMGEVHNDLAGTSYFIAPEVVGDGDGGAPTSSNCWSREALIACSLCTRPNRPAQREVRHLVDRSDRVHPNERLAALLPRERVGGAAHGR